jgi:hypothetical protein
MDVQTAIEAQTAEEVPIFCIYNCGNCTESTAFTLEELRTPSFVSQNKINEELSKHGHKKSLKIPKTNKFRNVEQAKKELVAHYKRFHNY